MVLAQPCVPKSWEGPRAGEYPREGALSPVPPAPQDCHGVEDAVAVLG